MELTNVYSKDAWDLISSQWTILSGAILMLYNQETFFSTFLFRNFSLSTKRNIFFLLFTGLQVSISLMCLSLQCPSTFSLFHFEKFAKKIVTFCRLFVFSSCEFSQFLCRFISIRSIRYELIKLKPSSWTLSINRIWNSILHFVLFTYSLWHVEINSQYYGLHPTQYA